MAASDLDKVRLLVERGAEVNARAKTGFDALMVAAGYRGTSDVVSFLLAHGAEVKPPAGVEIRYKASALFLAVFSGEAETVRLLAEHGAVLQPMDILGFVTTTPLEIAILQGDQQMVGLLAHLGANVNQADSSGLTPLSLSVIAGFPEQSRALIALGADVIAVDKLGMTPLLYAATHDHGDTATVEVLLKAGARPRNALALARKYHHPDIARTLGR